LELIAKSPIVEVEFLSRSWVNTLSERTSLRLKYSHGLDKARISHRTADTIREFYTKFQTLIRSFPSQMIFAPDETMVDAAKGVECIASGRRSPVTMDYDHLPYISAMLSNNVIGAVLPHFLILPHRATVMPEFDDLITAGRAWICTAPNACQTRQSFLIWAVCFCHWLNVYRASCQASPSGHSDFLLILDG
jgi:hypothetical protein